MAQDRVRKLFVVYAVKTSVAEDAYQCIPYVQTCASSENWHPFLVFRIVIGFRKSSLGKFLNGLKLFFLLLVSSICHFEAHMMQIEIVFRGLLPPSATSTNCDHTNVSRQTIFYST